MLVSKTFADIASHVAHLTGRPGSFALCVMIVALWAITGPFFSFSDTWQLMINTGTTIVTFLMVFLIQNTQNRDGAAIQAKLDELIRASAAQNRYIGIEHLTEEELDELRARCASRARAEKLGDAAEAADQAEEAAATKAARAVEQATGTRSGAGPS
jgi:low affinity Fe/Cu permease